MTGGNLLTPEAFPCCGEYMPTSERYRRRAEECRARAEQAHDDHERVAILTMAKQLERLAELKAEKEGAN